jgi:adenylyl- and sulfurtransferase ThiI
MYYIFVNKRAVLEDVQQEIINMYRCVIFKMFILRPLHDSCKSLILCVIFVNVLS